MNRNLMIMQNDFFLQIMVLSMYMKYEAMSQNHVNDTNGKINPKQYIESSILFVNLCKSF